MHFRHLVGVLSQDRERLGRAVGPCLAAAGAGALLGCGAGVVAVLYHQLMRPGSFGK